MGRRRGSVSLLSIIVSMMFLAIFLLLPLLRFIFPKFNSYFGFIPIFFFLPFFWSFKGRRRYTTTQKNRASADQNNDFPNSGSGNEDSGSAYYDPSLSRTSMWGYAKYLAMAIIVVLGIVVYFTLI